MEGNVCDVAVREWRRDRKRTIGYMPKGSFVTIVTWLCGKGGVTGSGCDVCEREGRCAGRKRMWRGCMRR